MIKVIALYLVLVIFSSAMGYILRGKDGTAKRVPDVAQIDNLNKKIFLEKVIINATFECSTSVDMFVYNVVRLNHQQKANASQKLVNTSCNIYYMEDSFIVASINATFDTGEWGQLLSFWLRKDIWILVGTAEYCNGDCQLVQKFNLEYEEMLPIVWAGYPVSAKYEDPWRLTLPNGVGSDSFLFKYRPQTNCSTIPVTPTSGLNSETLKTTTDGQMLQIPAPDNSVILINDSSSQGTTKELQPIRVAEFWAKKI